MRPYDNPAIELSETMQRCQICTFHYFLHSSNTGTKLVWREPLPHFFPKLSLSFKHYRQLEALKLGLQRPSPSSVLFSLSPVFLQISSLPLLPLFMCCFSLFSLCSCCSGVFLPVVPSKVFFTPPRTVAASC